MVQDLKMEREAKKEVNPGDEKSKRTGMTDASNTNRVQSKEERIADINDTIQYIDISVKENAKYKKFLTQNIQKIWDAIKKTKPKNNEIVRGRRFSVQRNRKHLQQNHRRKCP